MRKNKRAFTLVEIIIVLIILSTLIMMGIPFYSGFMQRSRDDRRMIDVGHLHELLQKYHSNQQGGFYPTNLNVLLAQGYIVRLPRDPATKRVSDYQYTPTPVGCDNSTLFCTGFTILVNLEQKGSSYTINSGEIRGRINP